MTPNGKIRGICVHHTASPRETTTMDMIRAWHKTAGYADVGYHYVIMGDGTLKVGRPVDRQGAGALGYNRGVLHICVAGNFENEAPTNAQIHALQQLLAILCKRYGLSESAIIGHRDVNKITPFVKVAGRWVSTATACPGRNLYRLLGICRDVVRGYISAAKKGR